MQELTEIFIIVSSARSKQDASMSLCYIFSPHGYVFETERKSTQVAKITFRKIEKSILRSQKTINSPKNSF